MRTDLRFESPAFLIRSTGWIRDAEPDATSRPAGPSAALPLPHPKPRDVGPAAARPANVDASVFRTAAAHTVGGRAAMPSAPSRSSQAPDVLLIISRRIRDDFGARQEGRGKQPRRTGAPGTRSAIAPWAAASAERRSQTDDSD